MHAFFSMLLGLLFSAGVMAQSIPTGRINGTVRTAAGEGIPYANVSVLNITKAAVADKDGQFTINLSAGTYQLSVSAVGFASVIQPITIVSGEAASTVITLTERISALDEVVVTAEKTETDVQKTPIAISVLNARQLQEYRVWSFSDMSALAPSLQTVEHGGSSSALFINVRGVMGLHSQSAVATYIDGVYQFESFSVPLQFNNVQRIEVLRGPQGTLYGRNAFGGVINIITKKPTNRTEGFAQLDLGNYAQQRYHAGFSTPIVPDKLFLGVSGLFSQRRGIYTNTVTNAPFDRPQSITGGLNLRYTASDRLSVEVNGRVERNNDLGSYPWVSSDSLLFARPYTVGSNSPNLEQRTNLNGSVNINYRTPSVLLTSISAYLSYKRWFPDLLDTDFTAVDRTKTQNDNWTQTFTQEFRVASNPTSSARLTWTVGTYLWTAPNGYNRNEGYQTPLAGGATTIRNSVFNNRGLAFFGQTAYRLKPRLTATLGLRYDRESRALNQLRQTIRANGTLSQNIPPTDFSTSFGAFTPKLTVGYQATDRTLVYAQYARGFRAGGLNAFAPTAADVPFGPEVSDNYEIGLKNTFFRDRLRLNLTGFYLEQLGQQINVIDNGFFLTRNTGDMRNAGLELEAIFLPVRGLRIEWNSSLSQAEYRRLTVFAAGANRDLAGNKPLFNPGAASFLAVQYTKPTGRQSSVFVRGEHRYTGAYYLNFDNVLRQPAFNVFNARAGATYRNYELAFWGRNVTNTRYRTWGTAVYLLSTPALWGATATANF